MKYLVIFISILILVSNVYSTKFNKTKFEKFLKHLKPGTNDSRIMKQLNKINHVAKEKSLNGFRFVQKNQKNKSHKKTEKVRIEAKYMTTLPTITDGWTTINTTYLNQHNYFPKLVLVDGPLKFEIDDKKNLINQAFKSTAETNALKLTKLYFYYRINSSYIYFSPSKESQSILFFLRIKHLKDVKNQNDEKNCVSVITFPIANKEDPKFLLCSPLPEGAIKLDCVLTTLMRNDDYQRCLKPMNLPPVKQIKILKRKINQPYIVIPTPQRMCNYGWNYGNKGSDWECLCKEGSEQSPIDLPDKTKAIISPIKPVMTYDVFNDTDKKIDILHEQNTLRILAIGDDILPTKGFGKIVTRDGTVYIATDIIFHTPSEHTIEGKRFPLELQILHEAKSKGDYGKKVILSFLFTGKPAVYNKFIDDLDFFNLPNPFDKKRKLYNKLLVPDILTNSGEQSMSFLRPFSFYTYQGSLTYPPCVENVIHYVSADPIPASLTALDMFKEALRMPDFEDSQGNFIASKESIMENYRDTQNLNGRAVFLYDHNIFNPPVAIDNSDEKYLLQKDGHYEKQDRDVTNYFYIEGEGLSGVPGAMIVSEEEAQK